MRSDTEFLRGWSVAIGDLGRRIAGRSPAESRCRKVRPAEPSAKLPEGEVQVRLLLDSVAEAIYGLDLQGNCTFANRACLKLLGYRHERELLGKNMHALIHHSHQDGSAYPVEDCAIYKGFQSGDGSHVDGEVLWRADGSSFQAEFWSYPVYEQGQISGAVVSFFDVSERKAAERRNRMLETVVDSSAELMFAIDRDGQFVEVNDSACRLLQYSRQELLTMQISAVHRGSDDQHWNQFWDAVVQQGSGTRETQWRSKAGRLIPVEISAVVTEFESQTYLCGFARDISQRRAAEAALQTSEERFELAMMGSRDGMWDCDVVSGETYYSPSWKRMLGFADDEIAPHINAAIGLLHPADAPATLDAWKRFIHSDAEQFEIEFRMRHKLGHYVHILSRGFAIRDSVDRQAVRVVGTNVDLTEQKRAAQRLNEFKTTLDQTHDRVFMFRPGTLAFYYVNQGAVDQLGYSSDELLQLTPPEIFPEFSKTEFRNLIEPLMHGSRDSLRVETMARNRDGRGVAVEMSLQFIAPPDEPARFVAVVRDISQRKANETALLRLKDEAERANHAKGDFLAAMSHELRTPLNGVIGMTELLMTTDLSERQHRFVQASLSSGKSLQKLINAILDFSKIESGKFVLDREQFGLYELVDDTIEAMGFAAHEKSLELFGRVGGGVPEYVIGDSVRLRQILVNLIGNAIKFTDRGQIHLRISQVGNPLDGMIRFEVQDSGVGIEPERIENLFEPFTQADNSTSRKYGGTGLGLSICKHLVKLMGGHIEAISTPGKGSTFAFEIPLPATAAATSRNWNQLCDRWVLLCVGSDSMLQYATETLMDWQMNIESAETPSDALQKIRSAAQVGRPYDVVVVSQPPRIGVSVADFLQQKRDDQKLDATKVLLIDGQDGVLAETQLDRVSGVVRLPLCQSNLLDALSDCLDEDGPQDSPSCEAMLQVSDELPTFPGMRVLLAEDNPTNQMFASEVLRQAGIECDCVNNGEEALVALRFQDYDLVLMDCHMPELDGFEATRLIRRMEISGELRGPLPIIALTANAIKGDRERCIEAGMDDYLSKPFAAHQLLQCIGTVTEQDEESEFLPTEVHLGSEVGPPADESVEIPAVIRHQEFLHRCMGNIDFAQKMLAQIEVRLPEQVQSIGRCFAQGDALAVGEAAHSLKGSAGIVGAEGVRRVAANIESAGRAEQLTEVSFLLDELNIESTRFLNAVPAIKVALAQSAPV